MTKSTYDFCLLYKNNHDTKFEVIELQTDDILFLENEIFVVVEEKKLNETHLQAKKREKLTINISIKFNEDCIDLAFDDIVFLSTENQCKCLRLITLKKSLDLMSSRNQIRKSVTSKD